MHTILFLGYLDLLCCGSLSLLSGKLGPMLILLLLMILAIFRIGTLFRGHSRSERLVCLKIINWSTRRIWSIIKHPIRSSFISVIRAIRRQPSLRPSILGKSIRNAKDLSILKATVHLPMLSHPSPSSMTDGVNLTLLNIQFFLHKVLLLVIRLLIRTAEKDSSLEL